MNKKILNQSLRCFIIALSMLLIFILIEDIVPRVLPRDFIHKYALQNDFSKHWFLNTVAIIYSVIAAIFAVMGTVFNQQAKRKNNKSIPSYWFLLSGIVLIIVGYLLFASSMTAPSWLTTTVFISFLALYIFYALLSLVCFFLYFITEIVLKIKSTSSVRA